MRGDSVDHNIVQDTELYYFYSNVYDKYCSFTINHFFYHEANFQAHEQNILTS